MTGSTGAEGQAFLVYTVHVKPGQLCSTSSPQPQKTLRVREGICVDCALF